MANAPAGWCDGTHTLRRHWWRLASRERAQRIDARRRIRTDQALDLDARGNRAERLRKLAGRHVSKGVPAHVGKRARPGPESSCRRLLRTVRTAPRRTPRRHGGAETFFSNTKAAQQHWR